MTRIALTLTRAGGWARMVLVAACTAVVTALLLVVVAILRLPARPDELLFNVVAEPGLRAGTILATVLLTLPPLLLLDQAVRLGTASRERRLAALRLAGATPGEVRRLAALEVGLPALLGGVAGLGLYAALRATLGGTPVDGAGGVGGEELSLVPTTVAPTSWQVGLVLVGVGLVGAAIGHRASSQVVVSPLGVSRRQAKRPPRPWGLLAVGAVLLLFRVFLRSDAWDGLLFLALGLLVIAVVSLVPWVAYWSGRAVQSRATSPAGLLAARRLVTDPRPAGRAAAAVGGIGLVSGVLGVVAVDFSSSGLDAFYLISTGLVGVVLLVALGVVTGSMAVHSAESLLDRKRSIASLVALGVPERTIHRSQRWEAAIAAVPASIAGTVLGTTLGGLVVAPTTAWAGDDLLLVLGNLALTPALVGLAIVVASLVTRPWAKVAASPANLRTE